MRGVALGDAKCSVRAFGVAVLFPGAGGVNAEAGVSFGTGKKLRLDRAAWCRAAPDSPSVVLRDFHPGRPLPPRGPETVNGRSGDARDQAAESCSSRLFVAPECRCSQYVPRVAAVFSA